MGVNHNLLVPAAQKLYSALKGLDSFSKHNDFFDNISSLDTFLSEYRNVTFVIQKSLAHTGLLPVYEEIRDNYLTKDWSKWFTDKRNEVIKEHPFPLQKIIKITIYNAHTTLTLTSREFIAENDVDYASLIDSLRAFLIENSPIETYFSVEFIFQEIGTTDNLFDKLFHGIHQMYHFLIALNEKIGNDSQLFHDTLQKIDTLPILKVNNTDLFVDDYVYYTKRNEFERGYRTEIRIPEIRIPISHLPWMCIDIEKFDFVDSTEKIQCLFLKFVLSHLDMYIMQKYHIMPTIVLLYDDDTIIMQSFDASLRTTIYRKLNKLADKILTENIKAVFCINEMWKYPNIEVLKKDYKDRVETGNPITLFTGHMVDSSLNRKSYYFETGKLQEAGYVLNTLKSSGDATNITNFMNPIIHAFDVLQNQK